MTILTASAVTAAVPSIRSRVAAAGRALVARLQRVQAERVAIAALEAIDDRMLADVGLTRSDIRFAVRDERHRR